MLYLALKELGAEVEFYIPNRFTEGYGPNEEAFRWAAQCRYVDESYCRYWYRSGT